MTEPPEDRRDRDPDARADRDPDDPDARADRDPDDADARADRDPADLPARADRDSGAEPIEPASAGPEPAASAAPPPPPPRPPRPAPRPPRPASAPGPARPAWSDARGWVGTPGRAALVAVLATLLLAVVPCTIGAFLAGAVVGSVSTREDDYHHDRERWDGPRHRDGWDGPRKGEYKRPGPGVDTVKPTLPASPS
jgi:hypothetical protein